MVITKENFIRYSFPIAIRILSAALQGLVLILIARSISINEFGQYAAAVSVGAIVCGIFGLGLPSYSIHIERENTNGSEHITSISLYLSLVSIIVTYVVTHKLYYENNYWLIMAGAAYAASEFRGSIYQGGLYAVGRTLLADISLLLRRVYPLLIIFIFRSFYPDNVAEIMSASYLSLLFLSGGRPRKIKIAAIFINERRKIIINYWLTSIWSMLQQLDTVLIAKFTSQEVVGAYSAAYRLASPVHVVTSIILSRLVPTITNHDSLFDKWQAGKTLMRVGIMYSAFLILTSPIAAFLIPYLLGESYSKYSYILPIPFVAAGLNVINQMLSAVMFSMNDGFRVELHTRRSVFIGIFIILIGGLLNNIYISVIGIAVGQLILLIMLWLSLRSRRA